MNKKKNTSAKKPGTGRRPGKIMITVFFLGFLGILTGFSQETPARPNIIIIMADDLGFSDLGCYGGEIHTPNLDRLAHEGIRMNTFYNTSRCCPSRAAMLTGLYPHDAGIGRMTKDMGLPGYQGTLDKNTVTIAEVLKKAGYHTGMVGKWHVSETTEQTTPEKQLKWLSHQENYGTFSDTATYPTARGFEKYYGNIWGVVDYYDPFSLVNGKAQVKSVPEDYYHTTAIGDTAVAYVEEFSKDRQPFFLYVAHTAPHWPLQAPEDVIKKYEKTYEKGWRHIRQDRYKKLIDKGIIRSSTRLPDFMFPKKDWKRNNDTVWDIRAMATHAAMIDILDQTVGKLVDKLAETGELDNTVIFFLSDNGASAERPSKYGPGFDRPGSTRDGRTIAFPVRKEVLPGPQTVTSGIGPVWAHVSNTPFRYWKSRVYEGGITTPFIAHWPSQFKKRTGKVVSRASHITDLMATCIDLAQTSYPQKFDGKTIKPTVGHSMLPILLGNRKADSQDEYFWEHFGSAALRKGQWKAVKLNEEAPWELYNLETDRTETNNVAEKFPRKLGELTDRWNVLARKYNVYPTPNN